MDESAADWLSAITIAARTTPRVTGGP
jgi:hypothetical protein